MSGQTVTEQDHVDDRHGSKQNTSGQSHVLGLSQGETHDHIENKGQNDRVHKMLKNSFHIFLLYCVQRK
jgi:hypothetical protein